MLRRRSLILRPKRAASPAPGGIGVPVPLGSRVVSPASANAVLTTIADAPAGDWIFVLVDLHVGSAAVVSDSAGNTYVAVGSPYNSGGYKQMFRSANALGLDAGGSITSTNAASRTNMLACCVSGMAGGAFDVEGTGAVGTFTPPSSTPPTVSTSAVAAGAEKIVFGWVELPMGGLDSEITDAGGFTAIDGGAQGAVWHLHWAYRRLAAGVSAAQTYAPLLSTARAWVTNIHVFKAA